MKEILSILKEKKIKLTHLVLENLKDHLDI